MNIQAPSQEDVCVAPAGRKSNPMKDRFSQHASQYAAFRPTYPHELYEFLLSQVSSRQIAWDCATGNGQVAVDLSPYFKQVMATDMSKNQLDHAPPAANILYSVSQSEKTPFPPSTFDLITVAQAIHWFNIPDFYSEAKRVAKRGGVLAVWGYGLLRIEPTIDEYILDFYVNIIGSYWDPERKLIDERYQTIPFPFEEISSPSFDFSFHWGLEELRGYLTTWSSVQKYIQQHGRNPVDALIEVIKPMWREPKLKITFPLFVRCGRIES